MLQQKEDTRPICSCPTDWGGVGGSAWTCLTLLQTFPMGTLWAEDPQGILESRGVGVEECNPL